MESQGAPITLAGTWFAAGSSKSHVATLSLDSGVLTLSANDAAATFAPGDVHVTGLDDPLSVDFPDGGSFVATAGDAGARALLAALRVGDSPVARLEKSWRTVIIAAAATMALTALFFFVILPAAAKPAAMIVPQKWARIIDDQTMIILDKAAFGASTLEDDRRQELEGVLAGLVDQLGLDADRYQLLMRHGRMMGPNAFAMPGGTIVVTDQMADFVDNNDQLRAVMAHEIGHVEERHGLQQLLRGSTLAIMLVMVGPDAGTISHLASGMPAVLMEKGYSRNFERAADLYACRALTGTGEGTEAYARIMEKLMEAYPEAPAGAAWFSTHPDSYERVVMIRGYRP
jgi:Zn-dependent protease with chaperone function